VIFRQFDGLGLGIKDHDKIIPAWSPRGSTDTASPVSRLSGFTVLF